jgi:uncharacterized RDD family membrane protein YckC
VPRLGAYGIDIVIFWAINVFTIIPILGDLVDIVVLCYMFLRDITGASLGKRVFGLRVIDKASGGPATAGQCICRNLFFAIPLVVELFPVVGFFVGSGLIIAVMLVELVMLLSTGERLGDKLAGTQVVSTR